MPLAGRVRQKADKIRDKIIVKFVLPVLDSFNSGKTGGQAENNRQFVAVLANPFCVRKRPVCPRISRTMSLPSSNTAACCLPSASV